MKALLIVVAWLVGVSTCSAFCPTSTCHAGGPQLNTAAIIVSSRYEGLREQIGKNDHPLIDKWAKEVGLDNRLQRKQTGTGFSWCLLFVRGVYEEAGKMLRVKNPLPKIAGVHNLWVYAKANELRFRVVQAEEIIAGTTKSVAGDIIIMLYSGGKGHTGLTKRQVSNWELETREGNTNQAGSREGNGVYTKRRAVESLAGVIKPL